MSFKPSASQQHFSSLDEWSRFGPDQGRESFPKFTTPTQTYQQWLQENPQGFECPAND
jgi:hypothetical protein